MRGSLRAIGLALVVFSVLSVTTVLAVPQKTASAHGTEAWQSFSRYIRSSSEDGSHYGYRDLWAHWGPWSGSYADVWVGSHTSIGSPSYSWSRYAIKVTSSANPSWWFSVNDNPSWSCSAGQVCDISRYAGNRSEASGGVQVAIYTCHVSNYCSSSAYADYYAAYWFGTIKKNNPNAMSSVWRQNPGAWEVFP